MKQEDRSTARCKIVTEVKKPEWYYDRAANRLYHAPDRFMPSCVVPVKVEHLSPSSLIGQAITSISGGKTYLIYDVLGDTVKIICADGTFDIMRMHTLISDYRFTGTNNLCCILEDIVLT